MAKKRKVLLIGWDAADWEHISPLLDQGLLPTLEGLVNRGVMGNLATLQPVLSPMLWNSIATGKFPDKHGIHGFIEPDPVNGGARPYTSTSRKCKAIWNILTQAGLRSNIVGWWASHPAEPINGNIVTTGFAGVKFNPEQGWSVPFGSVHPSEKAKALAPMKVFAHELTEAHLLPFIPDAAKIDQKKDRRLDAFAKVLADAATNQAIVTELMANEPWDFTAVYYDAVDHFSHGFMMFHPPKLSWVSEEDYEMFKGVVTGAYRFHDMMLQRLLEVAGPDTTVILCSDHGFESGGQRPRGTPREPAGPAYWHRQYGIVVIAGDGIKRDERIYGASLVDIAPTILTLFGLPVGEDMDGRTLLEAFEGPVSIAKIPSWDVRPGESGMHTGEVKLDRDQSNELMQQFAALGYIEDPDADKEKQAESAEIESKYNLARTYVWKNQADKALPLLEEISRRKPWEDRFLLQLVSAYFQAGYLRQAARLLAAVYRDGEPLNAQNLLERARIQLALKDFQGSYDSIRAAQELDPAHPVIHTQMGEIFGRMLRWPEAEAAYLRAIELNPDSALAHQGLSTVYRRRGEDEKTVDTALRAVGLLHRLPLSHFNLGVALARLHDLGRAIFAFETALRFQPDMINAHRYLAPLYRAQGNLEKAKFHRHELARLPAVRARRKENSMARTEQLFDLPDIPPLAERLRTLMEERPDPKPEQEQSDKTFVLVSGLPRSGTSVMMQLLQAGGLPPMTDGERSADIDNPQGYLEWEAIKEIGKKPELLDDETLAGKAIKCVSVLLPRLPKHHTYKIIFMMRPIDEVVASQEKMTERLGTQASDLSREELARGLSSHRGAILKWMSDSTNVEFVEIDYPSLVRDPNPEIEKVVAFLGSDRLPRSSEMAKVIDPSLHRKKS